MVYRLAFLIDIVLVGAGEHSHATHISHLNISTSQLSTHFSMVRGNNAMVGVGGKGKGVRRAWQA